MFILIPDSSVADLEDHDSENDLGHEGSDEDGQNDEPTAAVANGTVVQSATASVAAVPSTPQPTRQPFPAHIQVLTNGREFNFYKGQGSV